MKTEQKQEISHKTLTDIYHYKHPVARGMIANNLLVYSFFLPVDMLASVTYDISPILVVDSGQMDSLLGAVEYQIDGDRYLFSKSRWIGISIRYVVSTGEIFIVCKTWYGAPRRLSTAADVLSTIDNMKEAKL